MIGLQLKKQINILKRYPLPKLTQFYNNHVTICWGTKFRIFVQKRQIHHSENFSPRPKLLCQQFSVQQERKVPHKYKIWEMQVYIQSLMQPENSKNKPASVVFLLFSIFARFSKVDSKGPVLLWSSVFHWKWYLQ